MPLVSVIIPTYCHAEYILRTLDTVFAQTFRDYEVIVVNDGSPDDTEQVLSLLRESGRIRYYKQANQGVAATRNFGIEQAKGEFIALLDDDDLWPPDKLEWQVAMMGDPEIIAVGGGVEFITKDGIKRDGEFNGDVKVIGLARFFEGNPFMSPGQILFRKRAFDRGVRFDPTIWGADDFDFWMGITQHGSLLHVNRLTLQYRLHESNASRDTIRMMFNCRTVFEKRFPLVPPNELKDCRKSAFRWLYLVYGKYLIWDVRHALFHNKSRIWQGFLSLKAIVRTFTWAFFEDPWILKQFVKEMLKSKHRAVKRF